MTTSSQRSEDGASAPRRTPVKRKRTLTPGNVLSTTARLVVGFPFLLRSVVWPKTSKVLREKVCLGVTAINDCPFCAWGHSHWAISQGVSPEEVNKILSLQNEALEATDPAEAVAILFGQHYAEHLDKIDPESVKNLHNHFNPAQVREIIAYVYFITFTNLSGNTVGAVLDRIRGKGHPITVFQAVAGVVLAPVLFILLTLVKCGKIVGTDRRRSKRHSPAKESAV